jgi:hypothetical protein
MRYGGVKMRICVIPENSEGINFINSVNKKLIMYIFLNHTAGGHIKKVFFTFKKGKKRLPPYFLKSIFTKAANSYCNYAAVMGKKAQI